MGAYLALILILLTAKWLQSSGSKRFILGLLMLLQVLTLYATECKSAIVGLLFGIGLLIWWAYRFVLWQAYCVIASVLIFSTFVTLTIALYGDQLGEIVLESEPDQYRPFIWQSAYQASIARPLTGWGSSSFDLTVGNYGSPGFQKYVLFRDSRAVDRVHNLWLELLVEEGIPGFLTWISLIGWVVFSVLRMADQSSDRDGRIMIFAGVSALIAYVIHQLFNPSDIGSLSLFWWIIGWTVSLGVSLKGVGVHA